MTATALQGPSQKFIFDGLNRNLASVHVRQRSLQSVSQTYVTRGGRRMRAIHRLSDRKVRNAPEGLHCDGGGLYLQVRRGVDGLTRSWLFRYAAGGGKERMMGCGAYPAVSLAAARKK